MMDFTVEEMNFLCMFKGSDRDETIRNVRETLPIISDFDMLQIGKSLLDKLEGIPKKPIMKSVLMLLLRNNLHPPISSRFHIAFDFKAWYNQTILTNKGVQQ